jgi:hypothetical protein
MLEVAAVTTIGTVLFGVFVAAFIGGIIAYDEYVEPWVKERWRTVPDPPRALFDRVLSFTAYGLLIGIVVVLVLFAAFVLGSTITDGLGWTDYGTNKN